MVLLHKATNTEKNMAVLTQETHHCINNWLLDKQKHTSSELRMTINSLSPDLLLLLIRCVIEPLWETNPISTGITQIQTHNLEVCSLVL